MRNTRRTLPRIVSLALTVLLAVVLYILPADAATPKHSAYQSNLIATNKYQDASTARVFAKLQDDELRRLRSVAEVSRNRLAFLEQRLKASVGAGHRLKTELESALLRASDAQNSFTNELAKRDSEYARFTRELVASAAEFLTTVQGTRYLELVNQGDLPAWGQAKEIFEVRYQAQKSRQRLENAALLRGHALQALSKLRQGQETVAYVIKCYEELTDADPTDHWDWVDLARLYSENGKLVD